MASMPRAWLLVALLVGWALGHGTSWLMAPPAPAPSPAPEALEALRVQLDELPSRLAMAQPRTSCVVSAPDLSALRAELLQALHEERCASTEAPAASEVAERAPAPPEPSSGALALPEHGQRLLDEALRTRRWGDEQAEELRRLYPELTGPQREQLTRTLIVHINRGELIVETEGHPF
ncbi:hypothetical protein [Hyalangium gracile]|uniref:hypothetical protein n=1 Tax=Hyalangium gracile TaxID=394092 RepID=UPI001CCED98A|nr:hypothetical protein [Hyalangium gracile]